MFNFNTFFCFRHKNYLSSYCYFTMSGFKVAEIIKRIRGLKESIPEEYRQNYDEKDINEGLIFVLKKTLSFHDKKYNVFTGNREEFYHPEIGKFTEVLHFVLLTLRILN